MQKEFGIGKFDCVCSNIFYGWCSKDGFSLCKKCGVKCYPLKFSINPNQSCASNANGNGSLLSSTSESSYSVDSDNQAFNSEIPPVFNRNYIVPRHSKKNSNYNYNHSKRKFSCEKCNDTNINLNASMTFRPHNSFYYNYIDNDHSYKGMNMLLHSILFLIQNHILSVMNP